MSSAPGHEPSGPDPERGPITETLALEKRTEDTGLPASLETSDTSSGLTLTKSDPAVRRLALVGRSFDDLELLEELGRGGMGIVFKARQKSLDRLVAVKLLLYDHFPDSLRLARFQAEARAAASLVHGNIVQIYQVGECALGHYFAMEFIEGDSLETLIQKGSISLTSAVAITVRLAEAVHYAHAKGIVHRDLKPGNVMVDRTHRPVVMDFGIAKFVGKSSSLTQQGVIMGTPAYMSPEQASGAPDQIGPATDIYALGAILYTMLTGRTPYEAATPLLTVLKVVGTSMPSPVRQHRPQVPEELDRICMQCLSKQPAERPASAHALAVDLRRFYTDYSRQKSDLGAEKRAGAAPRSKPLSPPALLTIQSTGKQIRLRGVTTIGRASDCEIVIRAADVSKHHCRLVVSEGLVLAEDLSSANGTFVNGRPIQEVRLQDGDRLRVGACEFTVQIPT